MNEESTMAEGQSQSIPSAASPEPGGRGGGTPPMQLLATTPPAEIAFVEHAAPVAEAATAPTVRIPVGDVVVEVVPEAAAVPVSATAVAVEAPSAPTTLAQAAANDIAAALATAQRSRSRSRANVRHPHPSDLIEKKIVIRRDRWDALVQLTETLKAERRVDAEPSEVAAIVLEAGLGAIVEESRAAQVLAAPVPPPSKPHAQKTVKPKGKAKARPQRPTRAAPAKPRTFSESELSGIKSLVRGVRSDRAIQRTLALWLGSEASKGALAVPIEDLRSLCRAFKVYDTANFAQNMKKDSAFFTEVRDKSGDRLGYSLTVKGAAAVNDLHASKR